MSKKIRRRQFGAFVCGNGFTIYDDYGFIFATVNIHDFNKKAGAVPAAYLIRGLDALCAQLNIMPPAEAVKP